jgi:hypothetical protein
VTRCGEVTISTEVETALGRGKGGGNTNRPNMDLTVSKNEEEKTTRSIQLLQMDNEDLKQ